MRTLKSFFLIFTLFLILTISAFSNIKTTIDIEKIQSIGYSQFDNSNDNFILFQKIRKEKNSKVVAFWNEPELNATSISNALVQENLKFFDVINSFVHDRALVTKYNLKNNKSIIAYDIVFQSKKNPQIFVSINFSGKVSLKKSEISALINEAESFIK